MAFTEPPKAFDASNQALRIAILGKYDAPPRLCSAIKCMYNKSIVNLILDKVETSTDFKVGVKQGDSMTQVLFLFLMMAFAKTLEQKWTSLGLRKAQFARKDNSPRSTRQLVIHRSGTFSSGILFDLFCMIYVDDGAFVFESRTDIEKGITLISDHFARFGLKMHISTLKTSKTECVFSPPPGFFNTRTLPLTSLTTSTLSLQKKESEKKRRTHENEEYIKCKEPAIIKVKGGFVTFTKNFKYLGSYIS